MNNIDYQACGYCINEESCKTRADFLADWRTGKNRPKGGTNALAKRCGKYKIDERCLPSEDKEVEYKQEVKEESFKEINDSHQSYVTFNQALLLKELGFNWTVDFYYSQEGAPDGHVWFHPLQSRMNYNNLTEYANLKRASAPTLAQAQKWLREVKGINISIIAGERNDIYHGRYYWKETFLPGFKEKGQQWIDWFIKSQYPWFDTYEEALSAGLSKMLLLLTNKED